MQTVSQKADRFLLSPDAVFVCNKRPKQACVYHLVKCNSCKHCKNKPVTRPPCKGYVRRIGFLLTVQVIDKCALQLFCIVYR